MAFEVTVPSPGESVSEVIIDSWLKTSGEYVEVDDEIAEIQSDKAMLTLYAEKAGVLTITVEAGEEVEVGAVVAEIDTEAEASDASSGGDDSDSSESAAAETSGAPTAESNAPKQADSQMAGAPSPSAKRIMDDKGLKEGDVKGTGRGGRVTKADAQNAEKPAAGNGAPASQRLKLRRLHSRHQNRNPPPNFLNCKCLRGALHASSAAKKCRRCAAHLPSVL